MTPWHPVLALGLLALSGCYPPVIAVAGPEGCGREPAGGVVAAVNAARAERGIAPLRLESRLMAAAARHSADMAAHEFMAHTGSDGSSLGQRALDAGYEPGGVGEVVAAGHSTPAAVVAAWLRSRRHRDILLLPDLVHIGPACAVSARGALFWTVMVGAPPPD